MGIFLSLTFVQQLEEIWWLKFDERFNDGSN